eukprot:13355205-Alexandrium_andersonii.AAC.1
MATSSTMPSPTPGEPPGPHPGAFGSDGAGPAAQALAVSAAASAAALAVLVPLTPGAPRTLEALGTPGAYAPEGFPTTMSPDSSAEFVDCRFVDPTTAAQFN